MFKKIGLFGTMALAAMSLASTSAFAAERGGNHNAVKQGVYVQNVRNQVERKEPVRRDRDDVRFDRRPQIEHRTANLLVQYRTDCDHDRDWR